MAGTAEAALAAGKLTLSKLCGDADPAKCTADDLSSGATVKGLATLTSASWDVEAVATARLARHAST